MGFDDFLAASGLGELVVEDFFVAQIGVLAATSLLFIFCLVLAMISFRAAGSARRARAEAETQMQYAQDLAVEVRHLTAQVENAATRRNAGASRSELRLERGAHAETADSQTRVRVGAREETPEAEIDVSQTDGWAPEGDLHSEHSENAPVNFDDDDARRADALEAAKEAAAVPSSLLRGFMRRR